MTGKRADVETRTTCDHYALRFICEGQWIECTVCGSKWSGLDGLCMNAAVVHGELRMKYHAD